MQVHLQFLPGLSPRPPKRGRTCAERQQGQQFKTVSDDASHVIVDGTVVVNSGGKHGIITREGDSVLVSRSNYSYAPFG